MSPNRKAVKYFDDVQLWSKMQDGISKLFTEKKFSKQNYMHLYSLILNLCSESAGVSRHFTDLNFKLNQCVHDCLQAQFDCFLIDDIEFLHEDILNFYLKRWDRYKHCSSVLSNIFKYHNKYLNRLEDPHLYRDMYHLALKLWRDYFLIQLYPRLTEAILELIKGDRNGELVNTGLIKEVTDSFFTVSEQLRKNSISDLPEYETSFEIPFLTDTKSFYTLPSQSFFKQNCLDAYMQKATQWLTEEGFRATYLPSSTKSKLLKACEHTLITPYLDTIYSEFEHRLKADNEDGLWTVYSLMVSAQADMSRLTGLLEKHIIQQGTSAINNYSEEATTNPKIYLNAMCKVYEKYQALVAKSFNNDSRFVTVFNKACFSFVNNNSVLAQSICKSPELLAKFCDQLLKKSNKMVDELELEDILNQVILLLKYVEDEDIFLQLYHIMLAKRLVLCTSLSDDAEAIMISKLRQFYGYGNTHKVHCILKDIQLSRYLNESFQHRSNESHIDFNVKVLTSGLWPLHQTFNFSLPAELEHCVSHFTAFYSNQHSGRKLIWLHNISRGELVTKCFKKNYILKASTLQIAALLHFNTRDSWMVGDLADLMEISMDKLKGVLQTLIKTKLLLLQNCDGNNLTSSSTVSLVPDYKNKRVCVNINIPIKEELKTEQDSTHRFIEEERQHKIQAALVRIMKTRKSLKHQGLLAEVLSQSLGFKPEISAIKKCIYILIEKEYLARDKDQADIYKYLA